MIVGVGASAGGLQAFSELLAAVPQDADLALVLVQHLAPHEESSLPKLLAEHSTLPVEVAQDGAEIKRGRVYVLPPDREIQLHDHRLRLSPRPASIRQHRPVDTLFTSLAAHQGSRAVAVVLSGTASDGAAGVRSVKEAGGVTIAQEPSSARFDGMPQAAIATGMVDMILPPHEIAAELARLAAHPYLRPAPPRRGTQKAASGVGQDRMGRIFELLREHAGVDFSQYKAPTIQRRLERRMMLCKIDKPERYLRFLESSPEEVGALARDLLIHVTRFFREPESFAALSERVFPELLAETPAGEAIRVWVPGCSTGEEPYSIAMILREHLNGKEGNRPVQIFATDVSNLAVERARRGLYPEAIEADVSPERLRRFFSRTDGAYRVSQEVRDMCVFARQDVTRDPPFSRLNLIVCRNLLIYLGAPLQKKVAGVFHYALRPNGYLMLGAAETLSDGSPFSVIDKKHRIFRANPGDSPLPRAFAEPSALSGHATVEPPPYRPARREGSLAAQVDRLLLDRFAPPGVVVDAELHVVETRGRTADYLELPPGGATLHLLKLARQGLSYHLRTAVQAARTEKRAVRRTAQLTTGDGSRRVEIEVAPLGRGTESDHLLVLFYDSGRGDAVHGAPEVREGEDRPAAARPVEPKTPPEDDERIERLEQELAESRSHLQSIIQDLEAANEELQTANEEVLSSNEELQSTNEELDTAKEELQSSNEELNTLNEELRSRNDELSLAHGDLVNLLGSVEIAIVMVSGDLRIRRYTAMAETVLNLRPTDVGRPIGHIRPNVDGIDLDEWIGRVVDTVTPLERELRDRDGRWYSLRIRPYKSLDNRIDGAVVALFDVDEAKRHELELEQAQELADAVIETVRQPLAVLDQELTIERVNRAFCALFDTRPEEVEGRPLSALEGGQWRAPELEKRLRDVLEEGKRIEGWEIHRDFSRVGARTLRLHARRVEARDDSLPSLVLVSFEESDPHGAGPAREAADAT